MIHILSLLLFSFDIHGVLLDPQGRPVEGARVTCGAESTSTNDQGAFALSGDRPCEARIAKTGFAAGPIALEPNRDNRITLTLASRSDGVVVTATGAPIALEEAGVAATVVTEKEMRVRQYAPVADMLRDVAGINVVQTGSSGGVMSVFTRGGGSNSALVLLDGIPLTDPGGALNFVPLTTAGLEKIEVVRGPESALFGAEAASGVIQLFSKQGDPEARRPHGDLSYERGSFSTDHWTAGVNGGLLNRLDYSLTADQNRSTGQFPNNVFRVSTGTANVGYRLTNTTSLRGIFRTFDSFTGAPGNTFYKTFDLDGREADKDSAVSVRLDDARGKRFSQRAFFAYHRLRSRAENEVSERYTVAALLHSEPPMRPGTPPLVYLDQIVPVGTPGAVARNVTLFAGGSLSFTDRTGANYQATVQHAGGSFIFGYEFERQGGLFSRTDVNRRNHGFTFYDQYSIGRRIFISGGARVEHSSVYATRFAPRAAITFRLPTDTFLRFSVARGIKEPSLLETHSPNPGFSGNPNLKPEKTDSFEAGLGRQWWRGRLRTDVAYFRNSYTDLITFRTTDFVTFSGTWFNVDKSWARGVEVTNSFRVTNLVTVNGNYTRLYTRVVSGSDLGQQLLRRPLNSGAINLQLTPRRWTFMIGVRFVGDRRDSFSTFGATRIPEYKYAFTTASYQVNRYITPYVRVNNLSDATYQEVLGYQQWGRNASGGVRLTW